MVDIVGTTLACDSRGREFNPRPFRCQPWASCSHTCAFVTKQYNLVPVAGSNVAAAGNWEGNTGVALAMRHRLQWFIHLRAQGLSKGHEHPTNTFHGYGSLLP